MRSIVDRDGRLFGLINVIDALVLAVVVSLTPALYYGYRLVHQPPPPPAPAPPPPPVEWVAVLGDMTGMTYEALALVSVGDTESDANGEAVARIEAVKPLALSAGSSPVVVALRCVPENGRLLYKGRFLKVGSRILMEPDEWDGVVLVKTIQRGPIDSMSWLSATTTAVAQATAPQRRVVARVVLYNILRELGEVIHVGDRSVDDVNQPTMRVTAVSGPTASTVPGLVTVDCEVEFIGSEVDGQIYYRDNLLKTGKTFTIETDHYSLSGTLVDVRVGSELVAEASGA